MTAPPDEVVVPGVASPGIAPKHVLTELDSTEVTAPGSIWDRTEIDLPELLCRLGFEPDEYVQHFHVDVDGTHWCEVYRVDTLPAENVLAGPGDNYFGINPVGGEFAGGRPGDSEVQALRALLADLDFKPGGCGDAETASAVIDAISGIIGPPVAITESGHGLQPLWCIEDGELARLTREARRVLLRRWGRLARSVAAAVGEGRPIALDSVFDAPRLARMPRSTNRKYPAAPVRVVTYGDTGRPITVDELEDVFEAYGIAEVSTDRDLAGEPVSPPASWTYAEATCPYATTTISGWATDTPKAGRHQWLVAQSTRLAAMHRNGCLAEVDRLRGIAVLEGRFRDLRATTEPIKPVAPGEVDDALDWGINRAATKDEDGLAAEVGRHRHLLDLALPVGQIPAMAQLVTSRITYKTEDAVPATENYADIEASWAKADPDPPGSTQIARQSFPTGVFDDTIADMIEAVAEFTQTDPAMAGTTTLGVLAAAAGGRVEVIAEAGWQEPTNLYLATAAKPGERKSAIQAAMTAPLSEVEQELAKAMEAEISKLRTEKDIAERAAANAAAKAAKAAPKDYDTLLAEALADAARAEGIVVPPVPRIIADDVTPEAATSLLADHGRLAVISAEGGIFDIFVGRYTSTPNLDVWLKGHAGDRVKVDRKGRESEYIEHPALTVAVMIQPAVLEAIARNAQLRGRGLLARFLYSLPKSRVGYRTARPAPIPPMVENRYRDRIVKLTRDLADRQTNPVVITLDEPARAVLAEFQISMEDRLRPGSDLIHIADWATKLPGAAVRIAGLLHIAGTENYEKCSVTAVSMKNAVTIAEYFIDHAIAAFDLMGADPVAVDATTILDALIAKEIETFTIRGLRRTIVRSRFASGGPEAALQHLVDLGWLLPQPTTPAPTGRPPSPSFKVHPRARAQNAQNAQNRPGP